MKYKLRILNLEDNQGDSELVRVTLAREGIDCDLVRVETKADFVAAIERGGFDLILSDYLLPSFDGLTALKIATSRCPEKPFIFLSGAIGEEIAIETLKSGATDYVLKDKLSRLPGAIKRALLELEEQTRRRQAEQELEKYRKHLEEMVRERTAELHKVNEQLQLELSDRWKLEEKLRTASMTDELTGLLNRRGFLTFAQKQWGMADRQQRNFSVIYMDLDEMKKINDEFGHKEGDQALTDISNILKKTFRASDLIARIGGDEFTVLITEPRGSAIESTVARHIEDNLRIHNEQTEKKYKLSVSMGIVHYDPLQPCSIEELLDRADSLMYEHKQHRGLTREMLPSATGRKKQDRTHERYETVNGPPAELSIAGSVVIKNISVSGISVKTSQRLTKNAIYKIRMLSGRGEELPLQGMVVWSSIGKTPEKEDNAPQYEAGLRFIDMNDGLICSLKNLIGMIADSPGSLVLKKTDGDAADGLVESPTVSS
jgi:diguanylate cyclase (GGDEF)-like protein